MKILEPQVDTLFDTNPILELPFPHIYNHFCQIVMRDMLDNMELPYSTLIPYTFIFEKAKDFSNQSLESCTESGYHIKQEDFKNLFACANLNIVFPFIHNKIYSFTRKSENESFIDYFDQAAEDHELTDIILTNLSLPAVTRLERSPKTLLDKIVYRLKSKRSIDPTAYYDYISKMYSSSQSAFVEADIIPDSFYNHIGFSSSEEFKKIRTAYMCLGQTYIDVSVVVDKYLTANALHDTPLGKKLWQGLAMAKMKHSELKKFIQKMTSASDADFDKFSEFFFCSQGEHTNISNKFLPPFWRIEEYVYFLPAAVPTLLGARNLLIAIQNDKSKNKKYKYDSMISNLFEPELLKRAEKHFKSNGFSTCLERNFEGGEIDLLVYCKNSHTIITIQAKATLYPESARMARRLDGRIEEAVDQTLRFDNLSIDAKSKIYKKAFPEIQAPDKVNHLRGILTNSGFGTTHSWQLLSKNNITPINCNILKNVLPECSSLLELPKKTQELIDKLKSECEVVEAPKIFELPDHTIRQRHVETRNMKSLYEAQYWGEAIDQ
ncbi:MULTISPECIES: hypothetical protein [unclassified Pseudomonas]|uniref:hypothetical protein n=1 Tax=unclassified Pseudomonas TaxID=196821 RepID=UPI0011A0D1B0|nr:MULTISPECIES: hypothetical protein [unclassified Pseudomonas]MCE5988810.1 hypothetical protein [Pseudomonas sp. LM20]